MPMHAHVRPARPGLKITRPDGQPIPPEGEVVLWSSYWRRRQRDGDIEVSAPPTPAADPPPKPQLKSVKKEG